MRPPWRAAIRRQIANPIPVPGYSASVWSRWNMPKTRSTASAGIPMPLSRTVRTHSSASAVADTWIRTGPGERNLSELASRFWNSCDS